MKKFLICFSILAVFSCVLFFIGFTSLKIKADEFGVVVSKTSGVDDKPVLNGQFDWHWEFLLPTNAKVKKFNIKPLNVTKTVAGELPSGSLYTALFNSSEKFDYKFTFSMSLTVSPEDIIQLLKKNVISDNSDLRRYLTMAADSIAQLATDFYLTKAYNNPSFRPEAVRREDITRHIELYKEFPEVQLSVFALTECIFPDYRLYKQLQNQGIIVVQDFTADLRAIPPISEGTSYSYDSNDFHYDDYDEKYGFERNNKTEIDEKSVFNQKEKDIKNNIFGKRD